MAMSDVTLSSDVIAALRTKHLEFLAGRLTDDRAKGDFVRSMNGAYDHLLSKPIKELLTPKAFVDGLSRVLSAPAIRGFGAPIGREVHRRVIQALREHQEKLGSFVPGDARSAIDVLVARPDLLPEPLIRRVFEQEATEEMLRDVLYDALREFNDSVNPFFAEWGLPALIKKVMPIGSGTVIKSIGLVRSEFDKRLEPEIRKFLLVFSRKAKGKLADFVIAKSNDAAFVALRKNVVAFFYEQTLAEIVAGVDAAAQEHVDVAAEHIALEVTAHDAPRRALEAALEELVREHGDETLGAWLGALGVDARPELEELAELVWPLARVLLESPPARAFWERVTWEFYDSLVT